MRTDGLVDAPAIGAVGVPAEVGIFIVGVVFVDVDILM